MKWLRMLPRLLQDFFFSLLIVPKFRFDHRLFSQLVREKSNGETLESPEGEPEVKFTHGPIDGVAGSYNALTRRITIDALEIFLQTLHLTSSRPTVNFDESLRQRFDVELTRVLAHEGGHWHLEQRLGWLPRLEKILINLVLAVIGFLFVWIAVRALGCFCMFVVGALMSMSVLLAVVTGVTLFIYGYLLMFRASRYFFTFWFVVSHFVTYRVCYHERFARKFEKRPDTDPRWEGVIEVD